MVDEPHLHRTISADWVLKRIQEGKNVRLKNAIIIGDFDLKKVNLSHHLEQIEVKRQYPPGEWIKVVPSEIFMMNVLILGNLDFCNATFLKEVRFSPVIFGRHALFLNATFSEDADFSGATFSEDVDFSRATFDRFALFIGTTFSSKAWFDYTNFQFSRFKDSTFSGIASFKGAIFRSSTLFQDATFGEILCFRDAHFDDAFWQEHACRKAKIVFEKSGDREEAGYHFYREMDGKRRQKHFYLRYPEYVFIQLVFGYGVHPFRLMFCWFLAATIFALFYSANDGITSKLPASSLPQSLSYFVECFYFSVVTAITPGYGKYEMTSWIYQVVASIEAIFGTFMWAAFITTFAKKYMR
jgi:hypothetical protein